MWPRYINGFRTPVQNEEAAMQLQQRLAFAGNRAVVRPVDAVKSALPGRALDIVVISDAFEHPDNLAADMLVSTRALTAMCAHTSLHLAQLGFAWWFCLQRTL
eukprot:2749499-Amphidinium_carterae.1